MHFTALTERWGSQLHDRRHQPPSVVITASHGTSEVGDESPLGSGH
jgi:hypothetical protein